MNRTRIIRRLACALTALAGAVLALGAAPPAAFAYRLPPSGGEAGPSQPRHFIVTGGMPGWQIALLAVAAALIGATLAVLTDRALAARRRTTTSTA